MNEELMRMLVCPESRLPVRKADAEVLRELNERIRQGTLRNRAGNVVEAPLEEALIREDGKVAYPIRDGLPIMLVDEALVLPE